MARSPISRVGGKYRLADKIISLFPDHTLYVEVFGGAGHILFRKPPSKTEIYNDIDRNLVCFFSAVKDKTKCDALYEKLTATPYSRDVFNKCLHNLSLEVISNLERAYSFIVVNGQCFGGLMETWGVSLQDNKTALSFHNRKELLEGACERLREVQLECKDFRYILKRYDRPDTLFYLDPPYTPDTRSSRKLYDDEMTVTDHAELVDMLLCIKGKAILSGYDTPIYDRLVSAGWEKIDLGDDMAISLSKRIDEKRVYKQEFVWAKK